MPRNDRETQRDCSYATQPGRVLAIVILATIVAFGCAPQLPPPNTDPIPGGGRWRSFAKVPVPLHESTAAVHDGSIYYIGGRLPSGTVATVWRYDPPPVDAWTQLASHPGTPVDHMGAAFVDGILYVFGGFQEWPGPSVAGTYAWDPNTNTWTTKASMPKPLGSMGVGVVDGKIYAIGGLSQSVAVDYVFEYDPAVDTWTDLTSICPMPTQRDSCPAGTVDGKIYMIGGRNLDISAITGVNEVFDPSTRTWQTKTPMPTPRGGHMVAVLNGKVLTMGGEGANNSVGVFSENEEYDPTTDTWQTLSPMTTPRHGTQAGTIDDVVYVAAGSEVIARTYTDVNEGFSFTFE